MLAGCLNEEVQVADPNLGPVKIQMRNFNVPLSGVTLDNTAPDIYYFKQKEDGSYVFMLTSTNYGNFETNWQTDYVLVTADKTGIVQKTELKKLPSKDGITGTFEYVWDAPPATTYYSPNSFYPMPINRTTSGPSYIADELGLLYYQLDNNCFCRDQFFNLNPETGNTNFISVGTAPSFSRSFRTSDGGFITVGFEGSPDFAKYSASGSLQFRQPMLYWEARPSYAYLTERDGDFYFVALYNSGYSFNAYPKFSPYGPEKINDEIFESFSVNNAKSFFYVLLSKTWYRPIEIRFGPGKKQMAHRFDKFDYYQDYVEVPFEVWEDNRQVMVSFRDQRGDGYFDLVSFNYDDQNWADPTMSREIIWINLEEYAETPDPFIKNRRFLSDEINNFVWPYLAEGTTWNPSALPAASFTWSNSHTRPGPQIIKVNANGASVVQENFELGGNGVSFKTLYKSVPVLDGFVVLINAPQVTVDPSDPHLGDFGYQPTQLVFLDANFNQTNVIPVQSTPYDYGHQMESNSEQVFYGRITTNPNSTTSRTSLLLSTVINNNLIEKYLDFDVEKYRITPTREGGVAFVAWVRPTDNTRDLIFMEFDENLDVVTAPK
ncbi:MAG: hypothetical protein OEV24_15030 [Cyclobacteriaceae bacterium]|nr:hypothetical protein [Cyclobacteriaceae bacterium]MDH5250207.1 hypothetical protein [Cyclobacteriaceae bacterium]